MESNFSELMEYLDDKFKQVNGKVDTLTNIVNTLKTSVDARALDKKNNGGKILGLEHTMKTGENFLDKAAPKLALEFKH